MKRSGVAVEPAPGRVVFSARNPLPLDRMAPVRVVTLANFLSKQVLKSPAARLGLNATEWRVLALLASYPGATASEICERLGLEKMNVSLAVGRLLKRKLLDRRGAPTDRRKLALTLTAKGEAIYDTIAPESQAFVDRLLEVIGATELAVFMAVLERLEARARELAAPVSPAPARRP